MRPFRILDLFSGAGGAARGLIQAGYDVVGVDLHAQPHYPAPFIQADVLKLSLSFLRTFDAIWASPPCQHNTAMRTMHNAKAHVDLIPPTRKLLIASGLPYIIENVVGAKLRSPVVLCGTMFGLGAGGAELQRHREFETSFPVRQPKCCHLGFGVIGLYGGHVRDRRRREGSHDRGVADFTTAQGFEAMGVPEGAMPLNRLCQAIPPAYAAYLGDVLGEHLHSQQELAA